LGNINTKRDFTFIADTVNGFVSALKAKKINGEIINISSGFEISIKQLIQEIFKVAGFSKNVVIEKKRVRPKKSEVVRLLGSNKKAIKLLKWKPIYNNVKQFRLALKDTVSWYNKSENLNKFNANDLYE
ncbi:GDP-mannose 4,6-dehydratase, partial [Candidatus Pelagibacter sp.]|nr:GDP-mannose 4,6-dehydratase [Candidatus Pelagibacter sp.]